MDKREEIVEVMGRAACRSLWEGQPPCGGVCKTCDDGIRAALSALEQKGYAIVPVEPTQEMWDAGAAEDGTYEIWSAMLSSFRGGK